MLSSQEYLQAAGPVQIIMDQNRGASNSERDISSTASN
jgi:hypothetical protein